MEDSAGIVEYIFPELAISEDERIRKALLTYFSDEDESYDGIPYPNICAWIKKKGEQMPAEWSKADEDMIYNIRNMIFKYAFSQSAVDVNGDLCESEYIEADQWLRSLEDRCILQPKREWSKEDDEIVDALISLCKEAKEAYPQISVSDLVGWFKKLKYKVQPQPKQEWKPSDNELEVLRLAAEKDGTCLMGLYEQLKKLREE